MWQCCSTLRKIAPKNETSNSTRIKTFRLKFEGLIGIKNLNQVSMKTLKYFIREQIKQFLAVRQEIRIKIHF